MDKGSFSLLTWIWIFLFSIHFLLIDRVNIPANKSKNEEIKGWWAVLFLLIGSIRCGLNRYSGSFHIGTGLRRLGHSSISERDDMTWHVKVRNAFYVVK